MNYHTEYPVAPGVYTGPLLDDYVIVKTVLTTNIVRKENETILGAALVMEDATPLVIFEPMMQDMKVHKAYSMPIDEFIKTHKPV